MSDSARGASSSGATGADKNRVCSSCKRFLPQVEKDPHDTCNKCRGCSRAETCSVCVSWTEAQWVRAEIPSKRQVLKQKALSLERSKVSSEDTSPPRDGQEREAFASKDDVAKLRQDLSNLTSLVTSVMTKLNDDPPSGVSRGTPEAGSSLDRSCSSRISFTGSHREGKLSVAPGVHRLSSSSLSPSPSKKHRREDRRASRDSVEPRPSKDKAKKQPTGERRDGGADGGDQPTRMKEDKGKKRGRDDHPPILDSLSLTQEPSVSGDSRARSPSVSGMSIFASGVLDSSTPFQAPRTECNTLVSDTSVDPPRKKKSGSTAVIPVDSADSVLAPSTSTKRHVSRDSASSRQDSRPSPSRDPVPSISGSVGPVRDRGDSVTSQRTVTTPSRVSRAEHRDSRPQKEESSASRKNSREVTVSSRDTERTQEGRGTHPLPSRTVPDTPGSHIRPEQAPKTFPVSIPRSTLDAPAVSRLTNDDLDKVIKACKDVAPSIHKMYEDLPRPLNSSSPIEKPSQKERGGESESEKATRTHGKLSQDRSSRDGRRSDGPCSSSSFNQDSGRKLEGSGRLPRGLYTSGRDRDRDLSSREERSPNRSRSPRPRHGHLDDRSSARSGANSAGSRSRRSRTPPSGPSRSRDHSSRRRSASTSPRRRSRSRSERSRSRESRRSGDSSRRSDSRSASKSLQRVEADPKTSSPNDDAAAAVSGADLEQDSQTFLFGDYKFDEVIALLRKRCNLETFFIEETTPQGSTVQEALTKGRPAAVPSRELPWQKLATSTRRALEKQLEEDEAATTSGSARSGSDRFSDPIGSKLKWYPVRGEPSRPLQVNGKVLDLAGKANQDQLLKAQFSFSNSEMERLETVFSGMSKVSNFLDTTLLALSSCLKDADLPKDTESEVLKYVLAASRATETICQQAETSRANVLLRRRDTVLSKITSLPQEDRLRLRCAPLSGPTLFPDHLISTARDNTRSVVRDEAFRRVVQTPRTQYQGYQHIYKPRPQSSSSYVQSARSRKRANNKKNKAKASSSSTPSDPPPKQQQQQPQSFRGKGKGRGAKGRR